MTPPTINDLMAFRWNALNMALEIGRLSGTGPTTASVIKNADIIFDFILCGTPSSAAPAVAKQPSVARPRGCGAL